MAVRKAKGRAADRLCEHACGRPAQDWAYTGEGEFSRNPADYIALCRPCHRVLDHAVGEAHRSAKLTAATVRIIRQRAAAGTSQRALAREYGVSQPAIHQAVARLTWKHIT